MKRGWMVMVWVMLSLSALSAPAMAGDENTARKVFENITVLDDMSAKEGESTVWYSAKVTFAGVMNNGKVRIRLTENAASPSFVRVYFEAPVGQENKMLATALSALALTDGKVYVGLPSTLQQYDQIVGIYVSTENQ